MGRDGLTKGRKVTELHDGSYCIWIPHIVAALILTLIKLHGSKDGSVGLYFHQLNTDTDIHAQRITPHNFGEPQPHKMNCYGIIDPLTFYLGLSTGHLVNNQIK